MISMWCRWRVVVFFFFNDTATTEIYTLSLHDALPISAGQPTVLSVGSAPEETSTPSEAVRSIFTGEVRPPKKRRSVDRKSTRLNSSHANISYAVFCLKKKKPTELSQMAHQDQLLCVGH